MGLPGLLLTALALASGVSDRGAPVVKHVGVHGGPADEAAMSPGMYNQIELGGIDKSQIADVQQFYQSVGKAIKQAIDIDIPLLGPTSETHAQLTVTDLSLDASEDNGQPTTIVHFGAVFPHCEDTRLDGIIHQLPMRLRTAIQDGSLWTKLRAQNVMVTFVEETPTKPRIKSCKPQIQLFMPVQAGQATRILHAKHLTCEYKGRTLSPTSEDYKTLNCRHVYNVQTKREVCKCEDIPVTLVPTPAPTFEPTRVQSGMCTLHGGGVVAPGWTGQGSGDHYCKTCSCRPGYTNSQETQPRLVCSGEVCKWPRPDMCKLTNGEMKEQGWTGKDTGANYCNTCICNNGVLSCSKVACVPKKDCTAVKCAAVHEPCPTGQVRQKNEKHWAGCCFNPKTDCVVPSPVDCVVTAWSPNWGPCTKSCGTGQKVKTRRIEQKPNVSGKPCPGGNRLIMTRECHTHACPTPSPTKPAVEDDWMSEDTTVPTTKPTMADAQQDPLNQATPTLAPTNSWQGSVIAQANSPETMCYNPQSFRPDFVDPTSGVACKDLVILVEAAHSNAWKCDHADSVKGYHYAAGKTAAGGCCSDRKFACYSGSDPASMCKNRGQFQPNMIGARLGNHNVKCKDVLTIFPLHGTCDEGITDFTILRAIASGSYTESSMLFGTAVEGETCCADAQFKCAAPTQSPTAMPTILLTDAPTNFPTETPTVATNAPTELPTEAPTAMPTTLAPTNAPTDVPTADPTLAPTDVPTSVPSAFAAYEEFAQQQENPPTPEPSMLPTAMPSHTPTNAPSYTPTNAPTAKPSQKPTAEPSADPTLGPTAMPSNTPTDSPTGSPSFSPTTAAPTPIPTRHCNCAGDRPCIHGGGVGDPESGVGSDACFPQVGGACPAETTLCTCPCSGDSPCAGASGCFARELFIDTMVCPTHTIHCEPPPQKKQEQSGAARSNRNQGHCHCGGDKPCQHEAGLTCFEATGNGANAVCHSGTYKCDCHCQGNTPCKDASGNCVGLTMLFGIQSCPLTTVQCIIATAASSL